MPNFIKRLFATHSPSKKLQEKVIKNSQGSNVGDASIETLLRDIQKEGVIKMNVYIVKYINEWTKVNCIEGVFSSYEKASDYVKECIDDWSEDKRNEVKDCYRIIEWGVK